MNKKQKKMLIRIIVASVLMVALHFVTFNEEELLFRVLRFLLYLVPYLVVGYDILKKAFKGIVNRQVFDENFLMAVATIGAMAIAIYEDGDYTEAIAVMLFYQIGELFQSYAVGKSRRNISQLMDIRPDYANVEIDGQISKIDPDEVEIGTVIIVQPGEKVPIDGIVEEGNSTLNTSALTGESLPREVQAGDEIISGCIRKIWKSRGRIVFLLSNHNALYEKIIYFNSCAFYFKFSFCRRFLFQRHSVYLRLRGRFCNL